MSNSVTPDDAALNLMNLIAWSESKSLNMGGSNSNAPTREWLLRTYAQCLRVSLDPGTVDKALASSRF